MNRKYKISAIIAAGGSGTRIGGKTPKQYQEIGSTSALEMSINAFYNNKLADIICVVIAKEHKALFDKINKKLGDKLIYAYGGKTRQDSVLNGLNKLKEYNPEIVLIHDAARPFVSEKLIKSIIKELKNNDAVLPAVKVKDTIKLAENNIVRSTPEREKLYIAQTPQGFDFKTIYKLHKKYKGKAFTDDVALAEKAGIKVKLVAGEYSNYKITTPEDMIMAKAESRTTRVGSGFDVHQFEKGDGVILCGIKVPYNKKLKGHSDADCAWHALTDALLGAAGLGDIGEHFPDTDKKWKGADSAIFLKHSADEIKKRGGVINNIDITVICEEPKLKLHKAKMRSNTAKLLGLRADQVNVKATTTEKLGFLGRKEGLAATANVAITL